ncbi:MAG: fibronectin type III-like domain-contianing protein, partial [Candidatus Korobacteraceae bacterium]
DVPNSALYPFGYGMTYSTITYSATSVNAATTSARDLNAGSAKLTVSAEVRNTGSRPADEVVQLYIRQTGTSVVRPVRELKGFKRITLASGQSQKVEFTLGGDELRFWNIEMKDIVEPAQLTVWVAPDSTGGKPAQVSIGQ